MVHMGYDTNFLILDPRAVEVCSAYVLGDASEIDLRPWAEYAMMMRVIRHRAKAWALKAPRQGALDSTVHVWGRPFLTAGQTADEVAARVQQWLGSSPANVDDLARENLRAIWHDQPNVDALIAQSDPGDDWLRLTPDDLRYEVCGQLDRLRSAVKAYESGRGSDPAPDSAGDQSNTELLERACFNFTVNVVSHSPGWMSRGNTIASISFWGGDRFPLAAKLESRLPGLTVQAEAFTPENYCMGMTVGPKDLDMLPQEVTDDYVRVFADQLRGDEEYARKELTKMVESVVTARTLKWGWCEASEVYSGAEGRMN